MTNHLKSASTQIIAGILLGFVLGLQLYMTNSAPHQLKADLLCTGLGGEIQCLNGTDQTTYCCDEGQTCDGVGGCNGPPPASSGSSDSSDPCAEGPSSPPTSQTPEP